MQLENQKERLMRTITINTTKCTKCKKCVRVCDLDIITETADGAPQINDPDKCFSCGHCVAMCPSGAMCHSEFPIQQLTLAQPAVVAADDAEMMLSSRRSCRSYKKDLPTRTDLDRMFRVATMAPTAVNCEDREFVVITDQNVLQEIRDGLVKATKRNLKWLRPFTKKPLSMVMPKETVEHFKRMIFDFEATLRHVANGQDMFFHEAPALVLFTSTGMDPLGKDHSLHAMSYFMTQAQAMGYGTCINGHVQSAHKLVAKCVKIKKGHRVFGAITLGFPKTTFKRTVTRKPAEISWVGEHNSTTNNNKEAA